MNTRHNISIKGINVCNPVEVDREYLLQAVEYAHKYGFNHIQVNGPIHDGIKGNIDGMTPYRKYGCFDSMKDSEYINQTVSAINLACDKAEQYGIKIFVWHHELDLPAEFTKIFPGVLNEYEDVEVSHPLIYDFLENKIDDFFFYYPKVSGIVLTLHETKVPLLKLKKQKLGKVERVKYITNVIHEACRKRGKELIVRPFASIEEDYEMMTKAYEEISTDLPIMDKWTQFDWSLTLPHNRFFSKIKNNPLLIETDIFGEYFGKGRLPLMLKKHLKEKFRYCDEFSPIGYVNRVDRAGENPFGDINEVNVMIADAYLEGKDPDIATTEFFKERYPQCYNEIEKIMERTEDIQIMTFYLNGYYFTELSIFPSLNHSKNHFFFEQMRKDCNIVSNEWFIPVDWKKADIAAYIKEKQNAKDEAKGLLKEIESLQDKIDELGYKSLWLKFKNLQLVAKAWYELTLCFVNYVRYFETKDINFEHLFYNSLDELICVRDEGVDTLGDSFYCIVGDIACAAKSGVKDYIGDFVQEIKNSFEIEKESEEAFLEKNLTDFVICGGAMEGHALMKEVNFSDTLIKDRRISRIPGSCKGANWCSVNAHGWFSYEIKVKPFSFNCITVTAGSYTNKLCFNVYINDIEYTVNEKVNDTKTITIGYDEKEGRERVRIKFERCSTNIPYICCIEVS